jgi:hypothetical protein
MAVEWVAEWVADTIWAVEWVAEWVADTIWAVEWVVDTIWAVVAAEDMAMRWEVVEVSVEVKEI